MYGDRATVNASLKVPVIINTVVQFLRLIGTTVTRNNQYTAKNNSNYLVAFQVIINWLWPWMLICMVEKQSGLRHYCTPCSQSTKIAWKCTLGMDVDQTTIKVQTNCIVILKSQRKTYKGGWCSD